VSNKISISDYIRLTEAQRMSPVEQKMTTGTYEFFLCS
jgi:hypothetical protein